MANTPEIRFRGFREPWEQRKVAEITKFHKQGFYTTEDYNENKKYYLLRGTDLTENKLVLKDTPKIDATEKDYAAFKTEIGDFLIVRSGTVGTYGIVDVDIPAIFGSYLIDFRFDMEQVTNEFFGYFYQSNLFKLQLNKIIQASANTNINAENIKSTVISLPCLEEQRKISNYLGKIDNLITLHQRKYDEIKEVKKYMLQKMFPKNGEKVPEIRFSGFTASWEQRKLSDVVDSVDTGKSKFDKEGSSGKYPILGSTSVIGYDDEYDYEGDFILTARVGANAGGLYRHAGKVKISDNTVFIQASQNIEFLYQLLIRFDIKKLSFGTGQPLVKASELKSLELMMPTDMKEQMRIGVYFKNLDHLITLHQHKCDELKEVKKFMLQNMFPRRG